MRLRGLHLSTVAKLLLPASTAHLPGPKHVFICIADHYEPMWGGAPQSVQRDRVDRWIQHYPRNFDQFSDSRGQRPQHTFFYPAEEYNPEHIEKLAGLCGKGYGDVEVHLHHDNDTADNLRATLENFKLALHNEHGLLGRNALGQITYGFIHGNWALNNSRPDRRWCGVDDETSILLETGCYADFTMPSAPDRAQTRTVNSIYYAAPTPGGAKGHDSGIPARVGQLAPSDHLLMIQGPLALDWSRRKHGLMPGLENADLHGLRAPTRARLDLWLRAGVGVIGQPNWIFVKLHTHGAKEDNASMLLGEPMQQFHRDLGAYAQSDKSFRYYYVTTREMAALVHQAEAGATEPVLGYSYSTPTSGLIPSMDSSSLQQGAD